MSAQYENSAPDGTTPPLTRIDADVLNRFLNEGRGGGLPFVETEDQVILIEHIEFDGAVMRRSPSPMGDKGLIFQHCRFTAEVDFSTTANLRFLYFMGCVFNGPVFFREAHIPLVFDLNSSFSGDVLIHGVEACSLTMQAMTLQGELTLSGDFNTDTNLSYINYKKEARGSLHIRAANLGILRINQVGLKAVRIDDATRLKSVVNFDHVRCESLCLFNIGIGNVVCITNGEIGEFTIYGITGTHRHLFIGGSRIGVAKIPLPELDQLQISYAGIKELSLTGPHEKGRHLLIEASRFDVFIMRDVLNEGVIRLSELYQERGNELVLLFSDLGRANFVHCDFSKGILDFRDSKISEIFLSQTTFSKRVRSSGRKDHGQAQLAFGQLAVAFRKQGDTVMAAEYQSRELAAHFRHLSWFRSFFTRLNLLLNLLSNDFGRSWARGVLFTFLVGGIFFYALVGSTADVHSFQILRPDSRLFASYLKFMNPLRFFDTETLFHFNSDKSYLTLTGWSYFWDYMGRIFVAYGTYQTIQAFRRFGRA